MAKTINNTIINNSAGISGGGIYSSNFFDKYLIDHTNNISKDNIVNKYENNYASKPSYITLNTTINNNEIEIYSGDYLPLSFILYDLYDNIVEDTTKYYSSLILKLSLKSYNSRNNDDDEKNNNKVELNGNVGVFSNGNF